MVKQIPSEVYQNRISKLESKATEEGYDALLVHSTEADPADVRYLSNYWPAFEKAGVLVPPEGEAYLLIGPESETYARSRSEISQIRKILQYRESAEPEYPDMSLDDFRSVFREALGDKEPHRIGVIGHSLLPSIIADKLRDVFPNINLEKADRLMTDLRIIKEEQELNLLREAFKVSDLALNEVIDNLEPGMTELQATGFAQKVLYQEGAEYEGHPLYVLAGDHSTHAISRPTHRVIEENELVQLNIGARVGGYSSSIGCPVYIGDMPEKVRELVEFGYEAHEKTAEWLKPGIKAGEVAKKYERYFKENGFGENYLYGPCHGLGMMEVEPPWMETNSDYTLEENMTFQIDTFLAADDFGLRWEDGVRITEDGVEWFSRVDGPIMEIEEK